MGDNGMYEIETVGWEFDYAEDESVYADRDYNLYYSSSEYEDYSPSNPWDAPGMNVRDFI